MTIRVDAAARTLRFDGRTIACAIGKGGYCAGDAKREGDGRTPLGRWPVRGVLIRPDRLRLDSAPFIPWRWIAPDDGWCDAPEDMAYNRPVSLPYAASHERLWRDDGAYDIVIVLGHNDAPPVPGRGSAIFFHIWTQDDAGAIKGTEGCVAIDGAEMRALLPLLRPGMAMEIG